MLRFLYALFFMAARLAGVGLPDFHPFFCSLVPAHRLGPRAPGTGRLPLCVEHG